MGHITHRHGQSTESFSIAYTWNVNGESDQVTLLFPPFFYVCRLRFAVSMWKSPISLFPWTWDFLHFFSHKVDVNCRKKGIKIIPCKSNKGTLNSTMTWAHAKLKQQDSRYITWNVKKASWLLPFHLNAELNFSFKYTCVVILNRACSHPFCWRSTLGISQAL